MTQIHPTAIIEEGASLGDGVVIGPFCMVGPKVVLGDRVELKSHVVVTGDTRIGADTVVFQFAVIGEIPQDLKFGGEETRLVIGERNRIREHVTMNSGTAGGGGITRVGNDGLFMTGSHVAHDCQVGNGVILANCVALAGHVILEDNVIVGGLAGVHQFVRVGRGAIIGGLARVLHDVIPHGLIQSPRGELEGLNLIGLKRRGVSREDIAELRGAFKALGQGEGTFQERAARLQAESDNAYISEITGFILAGSDRSFLTPVA